MRRTMLAPGTRHPAPGVLMVDRPTQACVRGWLSKARDGWSLVPID